MKSLLLVVAIVLLPVSALADQKTFLTVHSVPEGATASDSAQWPERGVMMYGPTSQSCGTWLADTDKNKGVLGWWILGFVSGAARELTLAARNTSLTETDPKGIEAWITQYCSAHPLDMLVTAAYGLVDELKAAKR